MQSFFTEATSWVIGSNPTVSAEEAEKGVHIYLNHITATYDTQPGGRREGATEWDKGKKMVATRSKVVRNRPGAKPSS